MDRDFCVIQKVWHMDGLFGMFYMKGSFVDVLTHLSRDIIER